MPLPETFQFSQNNLQDYVDCPRRFELRHVLRQSWPAIQTEPILEQERHIQLGSRFHHMLHQHFLGIPDDLILSQVVEPELVDWWNAFLTASPLPVGAATLRPEFMLSTTLAGFRVSAKYDLILTTEQGGTIIFDWKTNRRRTPSHILLQRMQSRLYPLVCSLSLEDNHHQLVSPLDLTMIYWFTNHPQHPETLVYSSGQFEKDKLFIDNLIQEINATPPGRFILTHQQKSCAYCEYRSLCNRGSQAGLWEDQDEDEAAPQEELSINFEQIAEIEF